MKNPLWKLTLGALCAALLALPAAAADYPASGAEIPAGSALLEGSLIGETVGWNGQENKGRAAAFDGDIYTYYDPQERSSENSYCGVDLGTQYVLSKIVIMPREGWLDRYHGASIQGSNDMDEWETLWVSEHSAREWEWQEIEDFDNNTGFRYYRYWNGYEHGDVAEIELYGYPAGTTVAGPQKLSGEIIGERFGWDGSEGTGAAAAFDGDRHTYYDPTAQGAEYAYAGLHADQPYILSKVRIMPREGWTDRFRGGSIQGSNDGEDWTNMWTSPSAAEAWEWQIVTDFEDNTGYTYFRYWNGESHGDVGELEFFGFPAEGYVAPTLADKSAPVSTLTVTLDPNGVENESGGDPGTLTVTYGGKYDGLADLKNSAAVFEGWFTARKGGERVTAESAVTHLSDHTLYAHWTPVGGPAPDPGEAAGPVSDPVSDAPENAETAEAAEAADPSAEEEDAGFDPVPLVCLIVSAAAVIAAAVVLIKNKDVE